MAEAREVQNLSQELLTNQAGQRPSSCFKRACRCLGTVLLDLLTLLLFIVITPVVLAIMVVLCFIPALERLVFWRREYLDGVSATDLIAIPEAIIHGLIQAKDRVEDPEKVWEYFSRIYLENPAKEFRRWKERAVPRCWCWSYYTSKGVVVEKAHHFRVVTEHITQASLENKVAEIEGQLMDVTRPLWELYIFQNYTDETGKDCSVIMLRMHHCLADGFTGLRQVMQAAEPNKPPESSVSQARADRRQKLGCMSMLHGLLKTLRKIMLMPNDAPSSFKAKRLMKSTDPRHAVWHNVKGFSVQELKNIGKRLDNSTVNDLLMAALASSMKDYVRQTPNSRLPADINTVSWVSLSPLKHIYSDFDKVPFKWGNGTLGAVYLNLPIHTHQEGTATDMLADLKDSMRDPALMLEAGIVTKLLAFMGWFPPCIMKVVFPALANKVSASVSNVPGPQFPMAWLGVPVRGMMFFVPPYGTISIFVTIATWNGEISVGMGVDSSLMDKDSLKRICRDHFEEQLSQLKIAAGERHGDKV